MEIKHRHCFHEDAECSNKNEYENEKQQMKRKITEFDMNSKLVCENINTCNARTSSHLPLKYFIIYFIISKN